MSVQIYREENEHFENEHFAVCVYIKFQMNYIFLLISKATMPTKFIILPYIILVSPVIKNNNKHNIVY